MRGSRAGRGATTLRKENDVAVYSLGDHVPHIPQSTYIAPGAIVIGRVSFGERTSVWPGAVIRGDDDTIVIGDNSNVQDGAVLHVDPGYPMSIGTNVTVGHQEIGRAS